MATRTQAREMVVELLYAYTMGNERIFDFADELLGAKKIRNAQADFAKGLFKGILAHLQNIDSIIEANLKSWEISRLGVIDKCILRLGVYEILKGEIDAPVAINEAIEIAKILGAENTGKFVNGVLDAIRKQNLGNSSLNSCNSSLGLHSADFANLGHCADSSPALRPKFAKNHESQTENPSVVDSARGAESSKKDLCEAPENSPASWCKKSGEASSSASADFLLEAEKRGSPPKSEKAAAFWRVGGAGRGVQPFLRKEKGESKKPKSDRFAKSTQKSTQHNKKPTHRTKSTNLKNIKSKGKK